jgi:hypothetical protein
VLTGRLRTRAYALYIVTTTLDKILYETLVRQGAVSRNKREFDVRTLQLGSERCPLLLSNKQELDEYCWRLVATIMLYR